MWKIIVTIFLIDQSSKAIAEKKLKNRGRKKIGPFLLLYVKNRGAAMGFLKKYPRILKTLHVVTLLLVLYMWHKDIKECLLKSLSYACIIGGGLGNLFDRIKRGYVIDFFSLKIKKLPYFNMADIFVLSGILGLLIF
jgi:signal peptidase II